MNTVHVEQLAVLALDVVLWCMSVYRRATPVESAKYRWWLFRYKKTKHGIMYTKSVISETCEFECIFYYHHNSSSPNLPSLRPIDIADWMPERDTWNHGRIHQFQPPDFWILWRCTKFWGPSCEEMRFFEYYINDVKSKTILNQSIQQRHEDVWANLSNIRLLRATHPELKQQSQLEQEKERSSSLAVTSWPYLS